MFKKPINLISIFIIFLLIFLLSYLNFHNSSSTPTKSAFVILTTNDDLPGILQSIRHMEDRFNKRKSGGYDYVFLNDGKFSNKFKKHTSSLISTNAYYGKISSSDWNQPKWIDEDRASAVRTKMAIDGVLHGDSISYRNMCHYFSGKFYNHPLLRNYDYYWRVEPDVKYTCNLDQDPFLALEENNAKYGFTIAIHEYPETIPTLWKAVKEFMDLYPQHIAPDNSMDFISDDKGFSYNGCHFWSNFEIGDLSFYRSQAYTDFFNFLDRKGGFYYERWGDAPVHTMAAALLLNRDEILRMDPIGYYHIPYNHCPLGFKNYDRCECNPLETSDYHPHSCAIKWDKFANHRKWEID
ncbi:glycosyl transferase [Wallemia mellicola]|uniref:Glycosyl transferase n=2 Tax=Wallemia mellicola TaxID=1708541 RepID=A0A4T0MAB0_9BASI|nr:glycosyl transferase [Wallemia mellicola CBS 633.66]TIB72841.1 hypothetical protein E3Q24_01485 [Wallemia mellicola]EIM20255.1 glycosyl transferase [Wallemia mellicola CBS 633.66]TIB77526.1 hypothetical protein E3Q23_01246 [Wallemia mellicola]TIB79899.1 glycosyl transferase [Wallemia mellicola]TIB86880.1 glycosyl transferase [Wallemia mellicola]|eukprot:XP_006959743.1 glycosyl transferase [Wallemia mellicola CBS 633.66]